MANDEDDARIRQGVGAWNVWRAQNRERRVDLSDADLRVAKLVEAGLHGADLTGAKLYPETVFANVDLERNEGAGRLRPPWAERH